MVTRTFSKVGGLAGLRLGYLAAAPGIIAGIKKVRGAHEVNAVAIAMGCFVLDHPAVADAHLAHIAAGRPSLIAAATALGLGAPPCPTNFQLLELPDGLDPAAVAGRLKTLGYLIRGGFGAASVRRCLRVTLGPPDVMTGFARALATRPGRRARAIWRRISSPSVVAEQAVWAAEDSVVYYARTATSRTISIRRSDGFFRRRCARLGTCLDIGCAAGGFSRIMKSFNPALAYTGVDITPALIARARDGVSRQPLRGGRRHSLRHATQLVRPGVFEWACCTSTRSTATSCAVRTPRRVDLLVCDFRLTFGATSPDDCIVELRRPSGRRRGRRSHIWC